MHATSPIREPAHTREPRPAVTNTDTVDLVHLEDADGNRCIVRVTGRFQPGVLPGHDTLRADVLVSASFVDARLDTYVPPRDLDAWQRGLTGLAPGKDARIGGD